MTRKHCRDFSRRWNALSSTRWQSNAAYRLIFAPSANPLSSSRRGGTIHLRQAQLQLDLRCCSHGAASPCCGKVYYLGDASTQQADTTNHQSLPPHGRGCGVGRARGIGLVLGVGVGRGVAVGVAVGVGVGDGVAHGVSVYVRDWFCGGDSGQQTQ